MWSDLLSIPKTPLFDRIYRRNYKEERRTRQKRSGIMIKNTLLIFLLVLGFSCGMSSEEEVEDAIFHARQLLTSGLCEEALEALSAIPYQPKNVDYLEATASAHACMGGYSTIEFFLTDLDKIGSTQTALLGSLATFSTSNMTTSASDAYISIKTAINTLIMGGGVSTSSYAKRSAALGSTANNNISVFALYMTLVELGKFLNYYGDANDTTGIKGGGPQSNECYMDYADATALVAIGLGTSGACNAGNEGHASLTGNRTRACEGIVLFNNLLDILANVSFSGSNSGDLGDLAGNISGACTAGPVFNAETCTTKTFANCVSDTTNIDAAQIERFYAIVFENMHL